MSLPMIRILIIIQNNTSLHLSIHNIHHISKYKYITKTLTIKLFYFPILTKQIQLLMILFPFKPIYYIFYTITIFIKSPNYFILLYKRNFYAYL